jgi:hypothetical protein
VAAADLASKFGDNILIFVILTTSTQAIDLRSQIELGVEEPFDGEGGLPEAEELN